ncbi:hypothetical protein L332_11865 [Agrococcus pavilionensis RW1]|uniref:Addiction module toxin RelE n=1 Tax=Agrococcus pavilionensis RW1 TaxID=1330458 RepID=U1LSQ1_9MICO|nr:hypothetical protein [Agrococcus pavilionensis]ERG65132.1 hypothetical protein L332_11865 [Agrococcus pavilionensis RW1]
MAFKLVAAPGFQQDVYDLPSLALRKRAMELLALVAEGELQGLPLDRRATTGDLGDCRKLYFDEDPRNPKPNYRLVYRLTPNEANAVAVQAVAVGERFELDAYLRAQRNLRRDDA